MVVSYYIFKIPYQLIWRLIQLFGKNPQLVAYCAEKIDYVVLKPVLAHLPPMPIVAKDRKTAQWLEDQGIKTSRLPAFPKAVIMCRCGTHKFPEKKIVKFGFRHGAYHFKKFARAKYYNAFDIYFMTSKQEVIQAQKIGITSARAIGFTKIDPAFNNGYSTTTLESIRKKIGINPEKKTIIFTSTWEKSGMSAITHWVEVIPSFREQYNVLVSTHSWTSKKYIDMLKKIKGIYLVDEPDVLPYLLVTDLLIGDTSSIIAEFCALDKPIVTLSLPSAERTDPEIVDMMKKISLRVKTISELGDAIEHCLKYPNEKQKHRQEANRVMFDILDGNAGRRAADIIKKELLRKITLNK